MSRLFDAVHNARALAPSAGNRLPRPAGDMALHGLWRAVEARMAAGARPVVMIAPCGEGEADPGVAVRFARLAGRTMGRRVVLLDAVRARREVDEPIAFGPLPGHSNDARELDPGLLEAYWHKLAERAGMIVLDVPPVMASPLARALAPTVGGVVLVIEAERTRARVAEAARDALLAAGAEILGVVLNKRRFHVPQALYERL